ncbi:MAG: DUF885 domain-containing protein [Luteimonas sp.]
MTVSNAAISIHAAAVPAAFDDLCRRYWDFQCDEFPTLAIQSGSPPAHDLLLREAPADHQRRAAIAAVFQAELNTFATDQLTPAQQASACLLARELDLLGEAVAVQAHLRPSIYPLGAEAVLYFLAQSTAFGGVQDALRYNARLRSIPEGLAGVQACLRAGVAAGIRFPTLVVQRAVATVRGGTAMALDDSPYFTPFKRKQADATFAALAEECRTIVRDIVVPALLGHADFIESVLGAAAQDNTSAIDNPQGQAFYRHLVRQFTTLEQQQPDDIHAFGLAEVERLTQAMNAVAASAGHASLKDFVAELKSDPTQFAASGEALRQQIEVLSKRIDARLPEFFGRLPRMTYGVQSIPEAIAVGMPPAYAQPNPADGSAAGVHWINSLPERCPAYMHLPLALHEAWPGHLMHVALIQETTDLPAFRRYGALRYTACLEGWALYCEALGEELGLYDTPQKRYGRLEMELWRAARLVVDTGLHWRHWSREQAIAYMLEHMAIPRATIEAEVDRYIGMPAQALAYQLGNQCLRELRQRAQQTLGARFRLRDFHDALMAAGPVTLDVLGDIIDDWIAMPRD